MSDGPQTVEDVLASEYRMLRPKPSAAPLSALCISGGGIRSATFGLGAIQGLAARGILQQFDYLSTVSGGGYIGSWLIAWMNRAGGLDQVVPLLRADAPAVPPGQSDPIRHLREYSSYLTPKLGMLSFDVWALVATILRNIVLNWLVLIPLLLFVLLLPRIYLSVLAFPEWLYGAIVFANDPGRPNYTAPILDAVSGSLWVRYVLPLSSALLFGTALFNTLRYLPGVGHREHSSFDYLTNVLAPLMGAVLTFLAFDSLYYVGSRYKAENKVLSVVLWAVVPSVSACALYLTACTRSREERAGRLGHLSLAIFVQAASVGIATWISSNLVLPKMTWATYVTLGPPLILLGFALGTVLFVGFTSAFLTDDDREWMSRSLGGVLMLCIGWGGICAPVLVAPAWIGPLGAWSKGAVTMLGGASAWISVFGGRASSDAVGVAQPKPRSPLASVATPLATAVFVVLFAVGLSVLTDVMLAAVHVRSTSGALIGWREHQQVLERSSLAWLGLFGVAFSVAGWFMARYININTFSLHGMYRDRLVRAYLGASNAGRQADTFTGFAMTDDLQMRDLDPALKPFPVLNLTLNLVSAERLDWQQRKAEPFTVSPLSCGCADLGYRPASEYGGSKGMSLGTAAAISGAAVSPNSGYRSSPILTFILTLFNARLGFWMGNPGPAGQQTWKQPGPRSAIRALVEEALGMTSDRSGYVYLSDGGHFENLGLYEMVRRRCRVIVVLDAGGDPDFAYEDLGNALRKIRIDLKVEIVFDDAGMKPLRERTKRCAVARIYYGPVPDDASDGWLIYVKPMCLGDEPPDVASYGAAHPAFPHQQTAEQWFNEDQTESYRMLGLHTIEEIFREWKGGSLANLPRHVEASYLGMPPAEA